LPRYIIRRWDEVTNKEYSPIEYSTGKDLTWFFEHAPANVRYHVETVKIDPRKFETYPRSEELLPGYPAGWDEHR
jgi:hypothetical protein